MNRETISNVLCEQVINIVLLYNEAINTKITISVKNVENVSRFNSRIKSILKDTNSLYFEYNAGIIDYNYVINEMYHLYTFIDCTYKYNKGTFCFRTINSMKDVINETIENLTNK